MDEMDPILASSNAVTEESVASAVGGVAVAHPDPRSWPLLIQYSNAR